MTVAHAISGEGKISHGCYAFLVRNSNEEPNRGPENCPIKGNMFYLWGGNPGKVATE